MQFLDRWLDDARTRVTPKTHERYAQICHKNIAPFLGAVLLVKLRPEQISDAYAKALASGRVITQPDGLPLRPHSLGQEWVRFLAGQSALPRIRFHDLRHAHATHLLASGVHPKVASERLGHSKVGITLDLYSHVLPNMQADAAALVDGALRAVLNKREVKG